VSSFADSLARAVSKVTKPWGEIKKREDREQRQAAVARRRRYWIGSVPISIRSVAFKVIPEAYKKASGDGRYPANARQIMYAARPAIQEETGRRLDDKYFTQILLPDYIRGHAEARGWDVVYDARGHLEEPHNGRIIGIGTSEVEEYLASRGPLFAGIGLPDFKYSVKDIRGPGYRYGALLYIEKEGFVPLLENSGIPERYDLAVASSKGLSSTAARGLIAGLSGQVKILVLHDFDKAGFSILGTLQRDTRRYTFDFVPEIIDLGLRLKDVEGWHLQAEKAYYRGRDPWPNLRENGATNEEVEFLLKQRVELNAFTSEDFIAWLEGKLHDQGVEKLIPDDALLERVYRRVKSLDLWQKFFDGHRDDIEAKLAKLKIPKDLRKRVARHLDKDPETPWDLALGELNDEAAAGPKRRRAAGGVRSSMDAEERVRTKRDRTAPPSG
jgi:hypothetical protein